MAHIRGNKLLQVNLDDEQRIEAEDNYRDCGKNGAEEKAKPKRKRHKIREEGDEEEDQS